MSKVQLEKQVISTYAAAKAVNEALQAAGLDKTIPTPMMYNYGPARVKKGLKPLIATVETPAGSGKYALDLNSFQEWLSRYIQRQVALSSVEEAEATSESAETVAAE